MNQRVPPGSGGEQLLAILGNGQPARNESLAGRHDRDASLLREEPVRERKLVDDLELPTAGVEMFAIGSEDQPVKGLLQIHPIGNARPRWPHVNNLNFVLA